MLARSRAPRKAASVASLFASAAILTLVSSCSEPPSAAGGAGPTGAGGSSTSAAGGGATESGAGGSTQSGGGGGQAGAGGAFVPDPIPDVPDEPPAACAKAGQVNDYFQFLDNLCDEKRLPTSHDRDRACPTADESATVTLAGGGDVTYAPSSAPPVVDDSALVGIVPPEMNVTVILIRRVAGVPYYRYLSNGTHDVAYQPWSTTKFLAAANAAATLRIQSAYGVGLTASVDGSPVGDLVTSLVNYDSNPYSSNSLGRYFHNVGGRAKANDLIHALWLGRPAGETFGGNYGEAAPPLGYTFVEPGGASVDIAPDLSAGFANNLSSFTTAEALKRLVLHREEASQRLPGIQWKDIRVLLYGAEGSLKYGPWGGMSADTAIYLQAGHDIDYIEARSHGQWTIFSKLGLGTAGQFAHVGYACFPALDPQGQPVPGLGREFLISSHLASGGATWKERDRLLATYYRAIVKRIVDGRL